MVALEGQVFFLYDLMVASTMQQYFFEISGLHRRCKYFFVRFDGCIADARVFFRNLTVASPMQQCFFRI
jgi:hypothetical protein